MRYALGGEDQKFDGYDPHGRHRPPIERRLIAGGIALGFAVCASLLFAPKETLDILEGAAIGVIAGAVFIVLPTYLSLRNAGGTVTPRRAAESLRDLIVNWIKGRHRPDNTP